MVIQFLRYGQDVLRRNFCRYFARAINRKVKNVDRVLFRRVISNVNRSYRHILNVSHGNMNQIGRETNQRRVQVGMNRLIINLYTKGSSSNVMLATYDNRNGSIRGERYDRHEDLTSGRIPNLTIMFNASNGNFQAIRCQATAREGGRIGLLFLTSTCTFRCANEMFKIQLSAARFGGLGIFRRFFRTIMRTSALGTSTAMYRRGTASRQTRRL